MSDEDKPLPDFPDEIDWENLHRYGDNIWKIHGKYDYQTGLTSYQKNQLYKAKYPERSHKVLPDDQDYVMVNGEKKPRCIAYSKTTGRRCKNWQRKDYPTCRMHGAGTNEKPGGVQKWQRPLYKLKQNTDLSDKAEEYLNDPRFDEIDSEIAFQRALFQKAAEDGVNTRALMDILAEITKAIKRKSDIENQTALTQKELDLVIKTLKNSLNRHAGDTVRKKVIQDVLGAIRG